MAYFFDSSAVIKIYHKETGTEKVDEIVDGSGEIYISSLALIETIATLRRKVKERKLTLNRFSKLKSAFLYDVEKRYTLIPIEDSLVVDALYLAEKYAMKSLDSLQLASALKIKSVEEEIIFVSADLQLLKFAQKENFKIFNPEKYK